MKCVLYDRQLAEIRKKKRKMPPIYFWRVKKVFIEIPRPFCISQEYEVTCKYVKVLFRRQNHRH